MKKYQNKYRNDSIRLKNWDYASPGFYFVTICTKNRECFFGNIMGMQKPSIQLTDIGQIAHQYWMEIPNHFPFVELDEFIVMPDHIHGVLHFYKPDYSGWTPNKFGPQSQNLGAVIRGFKAGVKKYATAEDISFSWQSRYYEYIIRSQSRLNIIRQYIKNNPINWIKKYNQKTYEVKLSATNTTIR